MVKRYLFLFIFMVSSYSCIEKEETRLEKFNESIQGMYKMESISWGGQAIDLNNDGICSQDLVLEFEGNAKLMISDTRIHKVYPCKSFLHNDGYIRVFIPLQNITYDMLEDRYLVDSNWTSVSFLFNYGILQNGLLQNLEQKYEPEERKVFHYQYQIWHYEQLHNFEAKVKSLGNGELIVTAYNTFYDYSTEKIVHGDVTYSLKRVSYNVR